MAIPGYIKRLFWSLIISINLMSFQTGVAQACPGADLMRIMPLVAETTTFEDAVVAVEKGHYEEAIEILFALLEKEPYHAVAFNQLGYENFQLQNYDEALIFYRQALDIDPDHAGAHSYIGKAYLEIGDLTMAEYHLQKLDLLVWLRTVLHSKRSHFLVSCQSERPMEHCSCLAL